MATAASAGTGIERTADRRREEIVAIAAGLFDREGYHQTSMGQLAAAAGVAKPTLYHYFSGKEQILHGIHRQFIEPLISRHELRLQTSLGPEQLLVEAMGDILELMETHRGHVRLFFEHHRELPPDEKLEVRAQRDHYQQMIQSVVEQGIASGTFRAVHPGLATLAMFGMCNWAYQWYRPGGKFRAREIAYFLWDLFAEGLHADPSADGLPPRPER